MFERSDMRGKRVPMEQRAEKIAEYLEKGTMGA